MSVVLTVFIILASLLMIGIVLVQKSKGGGLASNFASSNQIMGVRKTTDFVEKATWTLAVVIMVLSIATVFVSHNSQSTSGSEIKDIVNTEAPAALPGFETRLPATKLLRLNKPLLNRLLPRKHRLKRLRPSNHAIQT